MSDPPTARELYDSIMAGTQEKPAFAQAAAIGSQPLLELLGILLPGADERALGVALMAAAETASAVIEQGCVDPTLTANVLAMAGATLYEKGGMEFGRESADE